MNRLLEHDHRELDGVLRDLITTLDSGDIEASFRRLDFFWARLSVHIRAENLVLFPAILHNLNSDGNQCESGGAPSLDEAGQAIVQLRADHDFFMHDLASAIKLMRNYMSSMSDIDSTVNLMRDVGRIVATVSHRLEAHNKLEEEQVYQWVNKHMNLQERAILTRSLRREIENLPPRFSG